jgi:hypothetical protein
VARRKPSQTSTGRLQSLRLFSTLLAISLVERAEFTVAGPSLGHSSEDALYCALCLGALCCFSWSWVSSADLHVVETTFKCGFDSFRAHHSLNNLAIASIPPLWGLLWGLPRNQPPTLLSCRPKQLCPKLCPLPAATVPYRVIQVISSLGSTLKGSTTSSTR